MQITYPFHQTEIFCIFYDFLICFASFYTIFVNGIIINSFMSILFMLSKEKKLCRNVALILVPQRYVSILLRALTLICKLPLIRQIWLETKIWPLSDFFALIFQFLTCLPFGAPCLF